MSQKIQFRRGTAAQLAAITPSNGEPIATTDGKRLAVGDGTTAGGVYVDKYALDQLAAAISAQAITDAASAKTRAKTLEEIGTTDTALGYDFVLGSNPSKYPIVHTRASDATLIDKTTGLVRTVGSNVIRGWSDSCGRQELWKAGSKNLLAYSNDFDKSPWTDLGYATGMVKIGDAFSYVPDSTVRIVSQLTATMETPSGVHTLTVDVRADAPCNNVRIGFNDYTAQPRNLTTDWQRFTLTGEITPQGGRIFEIYTAEAGPRIYFRKAQLEAGSTATAYEPNPVVIQPGLLLEGAATNLLLNSATLVTQSIAVTAGSYVVSFWGTGSVALSGAAADTITGSGASNREYKPIAVTTGTLTLTVTGSCTNAQLEPGTFPTSYIPTEGAAVTRAADVASIDVSKIWNPNEGTTVVEADCGPVNGQWNTVFDTTSGHRILLQRNTTGAMVVFGDGITTTNLGSVSGLCRVALSYYSGILKASMNGSSIILNTIDNIEPSSLNLGTNHSGGDPLNGTLQSLQYHRFAFDDLTLQAASELT